MGPMCCHDSSILCLLVCLVSPVQEPDVILVLQKDPEIIRRAQNYDVVSCADAAKGSAPIGIYWLEPGRMMSAQLKSSALR